MAKPFGIITEYQDTIATRFDPQQFVGRQWLIEEVARFRDNEDRRHLIIVGEPGSGKSTFLAYLASIWNCPRYFIRVDSMSGVTGTDPRAFLVSIGAQLYQKYGRDIFERAVSGTTTVTAGWTKDQSEVVGRFIDELYTLPFLPTEDRNVEVRAAVTTGGSKVIGERIRRLYTTAYDLDPRTLLHITLIQPLHKLQTRYPNEKVVMLVDALDESLQHPGQTVVDVIPRVSDADFPHNLRLVMTSRRGNHLADFREHDRLHLDDKAKGYWQEGQADLEAYVIGRLNTPLLQEDIKAWSQDQTRQYISKIIDNSDGNFLYLYHLCNAILEAVSAGETDLSTFPVPKGLDEIYRHFAVAKIRRNISEKDVIEFATVGQVPLELVQQWQQLDDIELVNVTQGNVTIIARNSDKVSFKLQRFAIKAGIDIDEESVKIYKGDQHGNWEHKYIPLLGVLAVAYDGLTREQLAAFAGVELVFIDTIVAQLHQFLDVVHDTQFNRYHFYHTSFREYLLDSCRNKDFCLNGIQFHERIALYYRQAWPSWIDVSWNSFNDDYHFRHLVAHLVKANKFNDLDELVGRGTSKQNWAQAHYERSGSYADYVRDLEAAWQQAETMGLDRCMLRYALIKSSIRSYSGLFPSELLVALVRYGLWTFERALAVVQESSNSWNRADGLVKLVGYASQDGLAITDQVFRNTLQVIAVHPDSAAVRARLMAQLAPYLPEDLLRYALDIAHTLPITVDDNIDWGREEDVSCPQSEALAALIVRLAAIGRRIEALTLVPKLHGRYPAIALAALLPNLSHDNLAWLCTASKNMESQMGAAVMMATITHYLDDKNGLGWLDWSFDVVLKAERYGRFGGRAEGLAAIAPYLTEKQLALALKESLGTLQCRAVIAVSKRMAEIGRVHEALQECRKFWDYGFWWQILPVVEVHLDRYEREELFREAVEHVAHTKSGDDQGFASLIRTLPDSLIDDTLALTAELSFSNPLTVEHAWIERLGQAGRTEVMLERAYSKLANKPLNSKDKEIITSDSIYLLVKLLPYLNPTSRLSVLNDALKVCSQIDDVIEHARLMASLNGLAPDGLPQVLLKQPLERAQKWNIEEVLRCLTPHLNDPNLLDMAAKLALQLPIVSRGFNTYFGRGHPSPRIEALTNLAVYSREPQRSARISDIVSILDEIERDVVVLPSRIRMLQVYAAEIIKQCLPDVVLPGLNRFLEGVSQENEELVPRPTETEILPPVIDGRQVPTQAWVSFHLELNNLKTASDKRTATTALVNAYLRLNDIRDEHLRALACLELVPFWRLATPYDASRDSFLRKIFWLIAMYIPDEQLKEVLPVVLTMKRSLFEYQQFEKFLKHVALHDKDLFEPFWCNLLRNAAEQGRAALFADLPTLLKTRTALETSDLILETATTINTIVQWWS